MAPEKVVTTASGLKYVDLVVGVGATPKVGQTVTVRYMGWFQDGKKFDSSYDHGSPFRFVLERKQVIAGWDEGVATMKAGGKRKLIIPLLDVNWATRSSMKRAPGTGVPPAALYISAEWSSLFGGGCFVKICWFAGNAA